MKRIVILLCAVLVAASFASCKPEAAPPASGEEQPALDTEKAAQTATCEKCGKPVSQCKCHKDGKDCDCGGDCPSKKADGKDCDCGGDCPGKKAQGGCPNAGQEGQPCPHHGQGTHDCPNSRTQ